MTDFIQHGTYAGSHAHYRAGEQPCDACRAARIEPTTKNLHLRQERTLSRHGCREAYAAGCRCNTCRSWRSKLWREEEIRESERDRAS